MRDLSEIRLSEVATVGALAPILGVKYPSAINNWMKRFQDFPEPVAQFGSSQVWVIAEVVEWHRAFKAGRAGITEVMARRIGLA